jgi:hypothetical protein
MQFYGTFLLQYLMKAFKFFFYKKEFVKKSNLAKRQGLLLMAIPPKNQSMCKGDFLIFLEP